MRRAVALLLTLVACAPLPAPSPDDSSAPRAARLTAAWLTQRLEGHGLRVSARDVIDQPFFSVPARVFRVEEGDLQFYEYPDAASAKRDAVRVSPKGAIGGSMPFWIAPPHFHRRENLLVIYLGTDARVLAALQKELGPQFAGQ